jgi:enoyl-CoA hydratase/carnithine racemase
MFSAAEALSLGLISRIVDAEELLPTAHEIAAKIAANPPIAVRMTKRLLRAAETGTLESVLQLSASMQAIAHATNDHKEAVMAFIEKRTPRFSGS